MSILWKPILMVLILSVAIPASSPGFSLIEHQALQQSKLDKKFTASKFFDANFYTFIDEDLDFAGKDVDFTVVIDSSAGDITYTVPYDKLVTVFAKFLKEQPKVTRERFAYFIGNLFQGLTRANHKDDMMPSLEFTFGAKGELNGFTFKTVKDGVTDTAAKIRFTFFEPQFGFAFMKAMDELDVTRGLSIDTVKIDPAVMKRFKIDKQALDRQAIDRQALDRQAID